ncbi:MAG: ATP-grasp domain-containing protein [Clostridia bacterium]|nr:ATP-grasp domain-containing protein [Clostridia bacterium]
MKALVLAGGFPQIALIEELKRRGYFVLLADYYENPVAKPFADEFFRISTLDVDAIKALAIAEAVDLVITACTDQALLTVAKVSEELGLPCYIDYGTALKVTNKSYMKEMFQSHGIPSARFFVAGQLCDSMIRDLRYPCIVKPVDCNSSKGVAKVYGEAQLRHAFELAVEYSRTDTAIVEEYIEGREITVDVQVKDGRAQVLSMAYSDKIPDEGKFVIYRTRYPISETDKVYPTSRTRHSGSLTHSVSAILLC